jgi:hypothetical protein
MAKLYYVGKDMNANDLTHWKYIKREKVNGKWRYYYKDDKTGRDTYVKKPDLKTKVTAAVQDKLGYDEREAAKNATVAYQNATKQLATVRKNDDYKDPMQKVHDEQKSIDKYKKSLTKYEQTRKAYAQTPLSKIENLAAKVEKSKAAIKNAANKTLSQIKQSVKTNEKVAKFLNVVGALKQASELGKHVAKYDTTWKIPIGPRTNIVTKTRHDRKNKTKYSVWRIK